MVSRRAAAATRAACRTGSPVRRAELSATLAACYVPRMALRPYIRPELTFVMESVPSRDVLFSHFVDRVVKLLPGVDANGLRQRLIDRERQMPTSTPEAVAFPHGISPEIDRTWIAVARIAQGVDFGAEDHPRARLVFCMFGSSRDPWEHVRLLARLSRICHTERARNRLRAAADDASLYQALLEEDAAHD
jgi:PTS system fructose-specific IIA component